MTETTGYTTNFSLPYPKGKAPVAVHKDIESLAQSVDSGIGTSIHHQENRVVATSQTLNALKGQFNNFKDTTENKFSALIEDMLPRDEAHQYGIEGPRGPAPHIYAGTTTQVDAGEPASLIITEVNDGEYRIDTVIPRGPGGDGEGADDDAVASHINTIGTATRQALERNFGATIMVRGATGDGSTNDSGAWADAIDQATSAGGGVVTAQRGRTYVVENLELPPDVVFDLRGITLKLPNIGDHPMFRATSLNDHEHAGIFGGTLDGVDRTRHGIDFSEVRWLHSFQANGVKFVNFDYGVLGSQDDRWPHWHGCRFWFNNVGMYVNKNHPIIDHCDFRSNDIGMTGRINDWYCIGTKFNYNRIGLVPADGEFVNNSYILGCMFFRNEELGIQVSLNNQVSNCLLVGVDNDDTGLVATSSRNRIQNNHFGYLSSHEDYGFGSSAVQLRTGSSHNLITGNFFQLSGSGIGIRHDDSGSMVDYLNVSHNTVSLIGEWKEWVRIEGRSRWFTFANNTLSTEVNQTVGQSLIRLSSVRGNLGQGGTFSGNTFHYAGDTDQLGSVIALYDSNSDLPAQGTIFVGNRFRRFATPLHASNLEAATFAANVGLPD